MWNTIQCAVQGKSHIKTGVPCQDKTYSLFLNGVKVIALDDGAGSAKLSHYGAESSTKFICQELAENFDSYFLNEDGLSVKQLLIKKILEKLTEKSKTLECEIKDLASTLLVVAIKENNFIISHIGDGVIGYLKNAELKIASQPENGEFINTTVFTTSKDAIMTMKLIKGNLGDINGFILMSDGTEESLYNKKTKSLADVLKKIMNSSLILNTEILQEQLQYSFENVIREKTTDDCSIVILTKEDILFKGYKELSNIEKAKLLNINLQNKIPKKWLIKRYDNILNFLENKATLKEVAKYIYLKPKYLKKYLFKLQQLNFIERNGKLFKTILILEKNY